jgi:hypothetical protein
MSVLSHLVTSHPSCRVAFGGPCSSSSNMSEHFRFLSTLKVSLFLHVWSDSTTEVHCISASHFRMKSNSTVFLTQPLMLRLIRYSRKCDYQIFYPVPEQNLRSSCRKDSCCVSSWGAILPFRFSESYRCRLLSLERRQSCFFDTCGYEPTRITLNIISRR